MNDVGKIALAGLAAIGGLLFGGVAYRNYTNRINYKGQSAVRKAERELDRVIKSLPKPNPTPVAPKPLVVSKTPSEATLRAFNRIYDTNPAYFITSEVVPELKVLDEIEFPTRILKLFGLLDAFLIEYGITQFKAINTEAEAFRLMADNCRLGEIKSIVRPTKDKVYICHSYANMVELKVYYYPSLEVKEFHASMDNLNTCFPKAPKRITVRKRDLLENRIDSVIQKLHSLTEEEGGALVSALLLEDISNEDQTVLTKPLSAGFIKRLPTTPIVVIGSKERSHYVLMHRFDKRFDDIENMPTLVLLNFWYTPEGYKTKMSCYFENGDDFIVTPIADGIGSFEYWFGYPCAVSQRLNMPIEELIRANAKGFLVEPSAAEKEHIERTERRTLSLNKTGKSEGGSI